MNNTEWECQYHLLILMIQLFQFQEIRLNLICVCYLFEDWRGLEHDNFGELIFFVTFIKGKGFHIRSSLDTQCTNPMRLVWKILSVFIENACTLSLLKWTFLACNWFLGPIWLVGKKMSELRIWNSFLDFSDLYSISGEKLIIKEENWWTSYMELFPKMAWNIL